MTTDLGRRRTSVLALNTIGFTVLFAVWVVFAIIGIPIREELGLTETEFATLVAVPILTGSLLRLPMGMATDRWGGRPIFTGLLVFTAVPLLLLCGADRYWQFIALGLAIGMAGTSFAVGIAYTSAWFPQRLQGTALGIFGAGNTGASLTKLFAPGLMMVLPAGGAGLVPGGWRFVPFVYAVGVLVMAAVYYPLTYTDHAHHKHQGVAELLAPLRHLRVWRFGLYYFLVFGGYVALSLWLPKYYIDVFGLPLRDAALLTALFVFPSGIIRAPGGWLSDRYGARTVMYGVLAICTVASLLLAVPDMDVGLLPPGAYAAGPAGSHLGLRMTPGPFTAIVFVLGLAMGIGKAAVFKHIPTYFPEQVGAVGGLVGVIGGLGGFVMPIAFGAMAQSTRLPTTTFAVLFVLSLVCLVWMHAVVMRLSREAAPSVADDLERAGEADEPALAPGRTG